MSDELKLEPCPNRECGRDGVRPGRLDGVVWHRCPSCGVSGPEVVVKADTPAAMEAAITESRRLWNALPRPLRWTSEPPKEAGLYLVKYRSTALGERGYLAEFIDGREIAEAAAEPTYWDVVSIGPIPEPPPASTEDAR